MARCPRIGARGLPQRSTRRSGRCAQRCRRRCRASRRSDASSGRVRSMSAGPKAPRDSAATARPKRTFLPASSKAKRSIRSALPGYQAGLDRPSASTTWFTSENVRLSLHAQYYPASLVRVSSRRVALWRNFPGHREFLHPRASERPQRGDFSFHDHVRGVRGGDSRPTTRAAETFCDTMGLAETDFGYHANTCLLYCPVDIRWRYCG